MRNFRTLLTTSLVSFASLTLLQNCGDSEDPVDNTPKQIEFTFSAEANGAPVEYSSGRYMNSLDQEFSIDRIKVYISNIKLHSSTSSEEFVEPNSYHLVSLNPDNDAFSFTMPDIPAGFSFDRVTYSIGIDAATNLSTDNTGDLDPANDMAWNWDTGYKFFLMEGKHFPVDDGDATGLVVHIGTNANLQTNEELIESAVVLTQNGALAFKIDALAPLTGTNTIDFSSNTTFKVGEASDKMAENYSGRLINLSATNF